MNVQILGRANNWVALHSAGNEGLPRNAVRFQRAAGFPFRLFFTDLPKSVPIPIGENQATFKATVAAAASGTALVTASCNGGSATGACAT